MTRPGGYGRYADDPLYVGCPRAASDMTPCIARDGHLALADDDLCVGCNAAPAQLLSELNWHLTNRHTPDLADETPATAAAKLSALVYVATDPKRTA